MSHYNSFNQQTDLQHQKITMFSQLSGEAEQKNEHHYRMRQGFSMQMGTLIDAATLAEDRKRNILLSAADIAKQAKDIQAKSDYNTVQRNYHNMQRDGNEIHVSTKTHLANAAFAFATVFAAGGIAYALTKGGTIIPKTPAEWIIGASMTIVGGTVSWVICKLGYEMVNDSRQKKLDKQLEEKTNALAALYEEAVTAISDPVARDKCLLADPRVQEFLKTQTKYNINPV